MPISEPWVWSRLDKFDLNQRFGTDGQPISGATDNLTVKLAAEKGWSDDYAAKVVEVYKRFLYLTQIAEFEVVTSTPIREAWQVHTTFTAEYRGKLLGEVLQKTPTVRDYSLSIPRAGCAELYDQSLDLYAREFDGPPDTKVWPDASLMAEVTRFEERNGLLLIPFLAGLILFGVGADQDSELAIFGGIILLVPAVVHWIVGRAKKAAISPEKKPTESSGGGGCGGCGG